jgi:hypothetical protein
MKWIPIAGALCAIAAVFYCAYTRTYDFVGLLILLVFFAYFFNLKSGGRRGVSLPSPASGLAVRSPIREVGKGLACLAAGAVGVVIGLRVHDVQLGVAIALTAAVAAIVTFLLFLLRAANAWNFGGNGPL